MPPVDRIHEQNEQDPGQVAHTRQEAGSTDFLAVSPALRILTSAFKLKSKCRMVIGPAGQLAECRAKAQSWSVVAW